MVVVPSCAVTTVVIVLAPTFKLMLPLATPVATAVPFTVTVALAWFTVGVTVIEDTLLATDCVYAIVPLANVGVSAPLEYVSPDKFASVDDGVLYVNSVLAALLPARVVTTTLAAPAAPGAVVAVICVELLTVKLVAAVPPMLTAVAPVKLVPVIVTLVPPVVKPLDGLIAVTVGRAPTT